MIGMPTKLENAPKVVCYLYHLKKAPSKVLYISKEIVFLRRLKADGPVAQLDRATDF